MTLTVDQSGTRRTSPIGPSPVAATTASYDRDRLLGGGDPHAVLEIIRQHPMWIALAR